MLDVLPNRPAFRWTAIVAFPRAAALAVAGLIKHKHKYKNKNVVLIICGNKISLELLQSAIDTQT